jgi:hypothetical protein
MLWLIIKGASYQIVGCNVYEEKGKFQLWIERPNGKTLKIVESKEKSDVELVKNAIDYAIAHHEPSLEL